LSTTPKGDAVELLASKIALRASENHLARPIDLGATEEQDASREFYPTPRKRNPGNIALCGKRRSLG
jgi:hypothetical protein